MRDIFQRNHRFDTILPDHTISEKQQDFYPNQRYHKRWYTKAHMHPLFLRDSENR